MWIPCHFLLFTVETSNAEQTDCSLDSTDGIKESVSACDQSTQTERGLNLTKKRSKTDAFREQGTTLPSLSLNETHV